LQAASLANLLKALQDQANTLPNPPSLQVESDWAKNPETVLDAKRYLDQGPMTLG